MALLRTRVPERLNLGQSVDTGPYEPVVKVFHKLAAGHRARDQTSGPASLDQSGATCRTGNIFHGLNLINVALSSALGGRHATERVISRSPPARESFARSQQG